MNKISNVRIKKSNTKSFTGLRIISENVNSVNDDGTIDRVYSIAMVGLPMY